MGGSQKLLKKDEEALFSIKEEGGDTIYETATSYITSEGKKDAGALEKPEFLPDPAFKGRGGSFGDDVIVAADICLRLGEGIFPFAPRCRGADLLPTSRGEKGKGKSLF